MASLRLYDYMMGVEYVDMDAKLIAEHKHSQAIMVKVECWDQDSLGSLGLDNAEIVGQQGRLWEQGAYYCKICIMKIWSLL